MSAGPPIRGLVAAAQTNTGVTDQMTNQVAQQRLWNRRKLLGTAVGISSAAVSMRRATSAEAAHLTVLCSTPPDPAPPGVADFAAGAFTAWRTRTSLTVSFDPIALPHLHRRLDTYFASGVRIYDLAYMAGWAPEFHTHLEPLDGKISDAIVADLPATAFNTSSWNGTIFGCPPTLSLLTLYFNLEHFDAAGIDAPPTTWDELKAVSGELTRDGRFGWVANYGTPAGIGGLASYWMVFLQQAAGVMYAEDGMPVFNDAPGIDALQFMVDLLPSTHPGAATSTSIVDASNSFAAGEASMMMNWPFMWSSLQELPQS